MKNLTTTKPGLMPATLPTVELLKLQAKRLRGQLTDTGNQVSHSQSLELLAHQMGYKDWNTLHAFAGKTTDTPPSPHPVSVGDKVTGRYVGQPFTGKIIGVKAMATPGHFDVTVHFDHPIDVVKFDSFSNMRQRVNSVIDVQGNSLRKNTHDGPVLQLDL